MHRSEERAVGCLQIIGMAALLLFGLMLIYEPITDLLRWMKF
jgi:hypothetical protein